MMRRQIKGLSERHDHVSAGTMVFYRSLGSSVPINTVLRYELTPLIPLQHVNIN